jgi:hypothetical protein
MRVFDRSGRVAIRKVEEDDSAIGPATRVFWLSALAASALAVLTVYGGALLRSPLDPVGTRSAPASDLTLFLDRGGQR